MPDDHIPEPPIHPHPLISITFEWLGVVEDAEVAPVVQHWYHVPRVGEHVIIAHEGSAKHHGTRFEVASVTWTRSGTAATIALA